MSEHQMRRSWPKVFEDAGQTRPPYPPTFLPFKLARLMRPDARLLLTWWLDQAACIRPSVRQSLRQSVDPERLQSSSRAYRPSGDAMQRLHDARESIDKRIIKQPCKRELVEAIVPQSQVARSLIVWSLGGRSAQPLGFRRHGWRAGGLDWLSGDGPSRTVRRAKAAGLDAFLHIGNCLSPRKS